MSTSSKDTTKNSGFYMSDNLEYEKEYNKANVFRPKPKGILIFDSFNNSFFPLDIVTIDKGDFNLKSYISEFRKRYGGSESQDLFMPFHYSVELIGKTYFPVQTRPIMYRSKVPGYEEYITICIMGNSEIDVYPHSLYKILAHTIINSLHYIPSFSLDPNGKTEYHKLGVQFKVEQLKKHFR